MSQAGPQRPDASPEPLTRVVAAVPRDAAERGADMVIALGRAPDLLDVALVHDAGALETALRRASPEERPAVVFLYRSLPGVLDGSFASYIARLAGAPVVLLVDPELQVAPDLAGVSKGAFPAALYAEAARAGCVSLAPWPPEPGTLGPLARSLAATRGTLLTPTAATLRTPVLGLRCTSGGTGTTELAINVAAVAAARGGRRVLLVDVDPVLPDVHLQLRLEPASTAGLDGLWAADAAARARRRAGEPDPLTTLRMGDYATIYGGGDGPPWVGPGRLDVLSGYLNRNTASAFAREGGRVVEYLARWRALYDLVVLDLGSNETPLQETVAAACDTLLVVTTPRRAELVTDAVGHQRLLNNTGLAPERCRFVLNRWGDPATQHSLEDASETFGATALFAGAVDEDDALVRAARWTGGIPALDPGQAGIMRPFVEEVEYLTEALLPGTVPPRSATGLAAALLRARAVVEGMQRRVGAFIGAPLHQAPPSTERDG